MVTMTSTLRCLPSSLQTWEFWRASSRVGTRIMAAGQGVRHVAGGATGSANTRLPGMRPQTSDGTLRQHHICRASGSSDKIEFACRPMQVCCLSLLGSRMRMGTRILAAGQGGGLGGAWLEERAGRYMPCPGEVNLNQGGVQLLRHPD